MEEKYYNVHVNIENGYSIGVKVNTKEKLTDKQIIDIAVYNRLFDEESDKYLVDSIDEITEEEYKLSF